MAGTEHSRLMNVVAILRRMYEVQEGRRTDLLPSTDMQAASDWAIGMGDDAAARIVEAENAYLASVGKVPDAGFDRWVSDWVEHPTVSEYWSLCEDSVSFTGQHVPYGERGMVDDAEARVLCDELRGKVTAAMDAGRRITEAAYPGNFDGSDMAGSIEYAAAEALRLMRVNPLAVLDLLDDCGDLLDGDTRRLARRLAEAEWDLIVERGKNDYANGVEGMTEWWRVNTLITRTGLQFPSLGAYRYDAPGKNNPR
ncbi:hypothetical protein BW14_06065 [Bifidobacterium sp. UTBIF-68]|uniref:hypothetical protein n=1 Tax=Bifidobacterium sp. UTBIF-68 TaxID=1465262 RepID=UPI00112E12D9|nr:hypothetical protein [Bifidobacterium sp. UTBIF-68]TPF93239.1 hypothetical protein BW14_06065 [Bifidobacterium sp. UTBIF-68]